MPSQLEMLLGGKVPTGKLVVCLDKAVPAQDGARLLEETTGARNLALASAADRTLPSFEQASKEARSILLADLGIAVIEPGESPGVEAAGELLATSDFATFTRPEFYHFVDNTAWQERYSTWVREGMHLLADYPDGSGSTDGPIFPLPEDPERPDEPPPVEDGDEPTPPASGATWGVEQTGAASSDFDGEGISICILDTGIARAHPDFGNRSMVLASFVQGEDAEDRHGHGTHCAGTAAGRSAQEGVPRYGVAGSANLFIGKVLDNSGSGPESWSLAGLDWALGNGCEIVSMSLGRSTIGEDAPDPVYESIGEIALEQGTLIIAAAGNGSARPGFIAPIASPANARSVMAVAALDEEFVTAPFSNGETISGTGHIDLAGPGMNVLSAAPLPRLYRRLSGTSMATPHVAGIAALFAQKDPALRGAALRDALTAGVRSLAESSRDIGAGLVFAPQ